MNRTFAWSLALGVAALLAAACGGDGSGATGAPVGTTAAAVSASATATASDSATATATATATVTASAGASGAPSAGPTGTASVAASGTASVAPTGTAVAGAKKFDCGEKGQKACPMQGWMKSAMGSAVASGDGERLARTLETVARKPVAGFGNWSAIAIAGAAKARAGDIDGAKESCKKCHDAYKYKYVTTMRDQPW